MTAAAAPWPGALPPLAAVSRVAVLRRLAAVAAPACTLCRAFAVTAAGRRGRLPTRSIRNLDAIRGTDPAMLEAAR